MLRVGSDGSLDEVPSLGSATCCIEAYCLPISTTNCFLVIALRKKLDRKLLNIQKLVWVLNVLFADPLEL